MEEIFKDIENYEGLYQISNFGRVYSIKRNRFLNPKKSGNGYRQVVLYKEDKHKYCYVHRLVAQAFIPNPQNLPQINHISEIKSDNRAENLEWCTAKYNLTYGTKIQRMMQHPNWKKTIKKAIKKGVEKTSKKVLCFTKQGKLIAEYSSTHEAARKLGISNGNISSCCKERKGFKSAGGYLWRYKEENHIYNISYGKITGKTFKKVLQLTKVEEFVAEFPSIIEAARTLGIDQSSISKCCKGKLHSAGGYLWKYKEEVE